MALTPADVVNRALVEIAGQATVTGVPPTFDGSAAGLAAGTVYQDCVEMLLRQADYEFARTWLPATAVTLGYSIPGWSASYQYPPDCLRLRQVLPPSWDANNPQAVRWLVGTFSVRTTPVTFQKLILTNQAAAELYYTTNFVTEADWDSVFTEAMVRLLASELAMGIGGRPDFSKELLNQAGGLVGANQERDS